MRSHLEKSASGIAPNRAAAARLAAELPLPPLGASVWALFLELHNRRYWSEVGPARFSWEAIQAWRTVRRIALDPWTLNTILALDEVFIAQHFEKKP